MRRHKFVGKNSTDGTNLRALLKGAYKHILLHAAALQSVQGIGRGLIYDTESILRSSPRGKKVVTAPTIHTVHRRIELSLCCLVGLAGLQGWAGAGWLPGWLAELSGAVFGLACFNACCFLRPVGPSRSVGRFVPAVGRSAPPAARASGSDGLRAYSSSSTSRVYLPMAATRRHPSPQTSVWLVSKHE